MEEEVDNSPFFWLQTTDRRRSLCRQASSIFLNSGVILVILLVIAFVFVFIIIPSFVSFTSQIFKPNLIKKSWDSLNLVLVIFAIICGFLSKNSTNNDNNSNNESTNYQSISNIQHGDVQRSYRRWDDHDHEYQNRTAYNTLSRLRSFSSYPDLRQESFSSNDERWRFYDDTHIKNSYPFSSSSDQFQHYRPLLQQENQETKKQLEEVEDPSSKDKEVVYTPSPPPPAASSPPPPPSPSLAPPLLSPQLPPSKAVRRKAKGTYQDLGHEKRREEEKDSDGDKFYVPPPSSSPPPAPGPPLPTQVPPLKAVRRKVKRNYQDLEHGKRIEEEKYLEEKKFYIPPAPPSPPTPPPPPSLPHKKRGKENLLTALRRKKKKQRQKSVENLESLFNLEPSTLSFIPPPPPPPPPHFFQNLFSSTKKGKSKKIQHSAPPPPPPPPPPAKISSSQTHVESRASRTTAQVAEVTTHHPPKAVKTMAANNFSRVEENVESGNASPLIPIPPPPPPPPFKMRSWKFVRDGDYVRVASFNSSRSGSPDLDSEEPSDKESMTPVARKEGDSSSSSTMPLFCPSPDVNTKAENFIARFRAGLKLEKINSVKGRSNLCPPGPDPVEKEDPN